jgi:hypothetical protein
MLFRFVIPNQVWNDEQKSVHPIALGLKALELDPSKNPAIRPLCAKGGIPEAFRPRQLVKAIRPS